LGVSQVVVVVVVVVRSQWLFFTRHARELLHRAELPNVLRQPLEGVAIEVEDPQGLQPSLERVHVGENVVAQV